MAAFPLLKLGTLALRQISKPLANHLKTKAKNSDFFRNKICIPPAQFYHWCEVNVKARLLNLGSPKEVARLNEQAAIDLGSELIGDMFIFFVGAAAIVAEYARQSRKVSDEKAALESRLQDIENQNGNLFELSKTMEERCVNIENQLEEIKLKFDKVIADK